MTTRDFDEADDAGADVDRPETFGAGENEPTVTRISRADLRRYTDRLADEAGSQSPQDRPLPPLSGDVAKGVFGGEAEDEDDDVTPTTVASPPLVTRRPATTTPAERPTPVAGEVAAERPAPAVPTTPAERPTPVERTARVERTTPAERKAPVDATMPVERTTLGERMARAERPDPVEQPTQVQRTVPLRPPTAAPPVDPQTGVTPPSVRYDDPVDDESVDEAALLAERRADRDRALGKRRPQPAPMAVPTPPSTALDRTTDRFPVALAMFLLRLALAAVLGIRGAQQLMDIPGTIATFAGTALPYPEIFAWATASASVLIAVALVFGLATRVAGLGTMLIGVGALVFVYWWKSPFEAGMPGFHGETELLLAVIGLLLLLAGGGSWGIDAAVRKGRLQRKADRYDAELI